MILIKDRHSSKNLKSLISFTGKYDTYKGSTLLLLEKTTLLMFVMGNMILIKDRHSTKSPSFRIRSYGKYDTYKGSTQVLKHHIVYPKVLENMILIKDRHMLFMFLSSLSLFSGKYDTYKGSTLV